MVGRLLAGEMVCSPAPGMAKVMVSVPALPLASRMAWRSEPAPRSSVFVTGNVAACAPAALRTAMIRTRKSRMNTLSSPAWPVVPREDDGENLPRLLGSVFELRFSIFELRAPSSELRNSKIENRLGASLASRPEIHEHSPDTGGRRRSGYAESTEDVAGARRLRADHRGERGRGTRGHRGERLRRHRARPHDAESL